MNNTRRRQRHKTKTPSIPPTDISPSQLWFQNPRGFFIDGRPALDYSPPGQIENILLASTYAAKTGKKRPIGLYAAKMQDSKPIPKTNKNLPPLSPIAREGAEGSAVAIARKSSIDNVDVPLAALSVADEETEASKERARRISTESYAINSAADSLLCDEGSEAVGEDIGTVEMEDNAEASEDGETDEHVTILSASSANANGNYATESTRLSATIGEAEASDETDERPSGGSDQDERRSQHPGEGKTNGTSGASTPSRKRKARSTSTITSAATTARQKPAKKAALKEKDEGEAPKIKKEKERGARTAKNGVKLEHAAKEESAGLKLKQSEEAQPLLSTSHAKKVDEFWQKLLRRFGGDPSSPPGSVIEPLPDPAMLECIEVMLEINQKKDVVNVLQKLGTTLEKHGAQDLWNEFLQLLRELGVATLFPPPAADSADEADDDQEDQDALDAAYDRRPRRRAAQAAEASTRKAIKRRKKEEEEDEDYFDEEDEEEKPKKRGRKAGAGRGKKGAARKAKGKSTSTARQRSSPNKWTKAENAKLIALVEEYQQGPKNWTAIADALGTTKSGPQCAQHWRRVLDPAIRKGPFTTSEDRKLLAAVRKYGLNSWRDVANELVGRTDIQCRYRYLSREFTSKWGLE